MGRRERAALRADARAFARQELRAVGRKPGTAVVRAIARDVVAHHRATGRLPWRVA